MNGLYTLLLFLFILGTVTQGVNELGIFDFKVPTNGAQLNQSTVVNIQEGTAALDYNPVNYAMMIGSFMKVIGAGILAMFAVAPLIYNFMVMLGFGAGLATIVSLAVQAPITFITLFGLFEWWTGRQVT